MKPRAAQDPGAEADAEPSASTPVYLLYGDDYRVKEAARRLVDALCPPDQQVFGLEEIDSSHDTADQAAATLRRVLMAVATASFLGGRKVVWYRAGGFFESPKVLRSAAATPWVEKLTEHLRQGLPEGHQLIVTGTGIDRRSAFFKVCNDKGDVVAYTLPEKSWEMERYAGALVRRALDPAGLRMRPEALTAFVDAVGPDARTIQSEVEKLVLYVTGRKEITVEDVRAITSPAREVEGWDLADRVGARDAPGALAVLRRLLQQKVEPILMVGGLESRFRELSIFRDALDRGWVRFNGREAAWTGGPEMAAALAGLGEWNPSRMHPFRAGKLVEQARGFSAAELARASAAITRTREQMAGGFSAADLLIEMLVLRIARKRPGGR